MDFVERIATKYAEKADRFFKKQRDPYELANLFGVFRVGEHHAVITIGDWLKSTPELEVKSGFARLIWDEARHTNIWTRRMMELIGEERVLSDFPDPARVNGVGENYFDMWDHYAKAPTLAERLPYIYLIDAWAAIAYEIYLNYIDSVTKWHLQTILHDEKFHVSFGKEMAQKYVTDKRHQEVLDREEEKIEKLLNEVTDGLMSSDL